VKLILGLRLVQKMVFFFQICLIYGLTIQVAIKGYGVVISFATCAMHEYKPKKKLNWFLATT
jgi:hypothetical protein